MVTEASPDFFISRKNAGNETLTDKELLDFRTNWLEIERHKHPDPDPSGALRPAIKVAYPHNGGLAIPDDTLTLVTYTDIVHTGSDTPVPTLVSNVVVVPLDGIYHMTAACGFDTLSNDTYEMRILLQQNGGPIDNVFGVTDQQWQGDGSESTAQIWGGQASTDVACSATDTLGVSVILRSLFMSTANLRQSFLSVHMVAPFAP